MSAQIHPTKYDIAIPSRRTLLVTHLHLRRSRGVKILQQCWLLFRNISKLVAVEPPIKQKHACENGWTSCMFVNSRGETSSHIFEECITFLNLPVCIRTTMVSKHILIWLRGIRKKKRFWNSSAIIAFKWYDLRHSRCPNPCTEAGTLYFCFGAFKTACTNQIGVQYRQSYLQMHIKPWHFLQEKHLGSLLCESELLLLLQRHVIHAL